MKKIKFHRAVQLFLLVAMMLTSTGFSAVIGYCSMSQSSVCCCDMEQTCKGTIPSKSLILKSVPSSCYSERVVGGVNEVKAVFNTESVQKQFFLAATLETQEYHVVDLTEQESRFPIAPHIALNPSGVEIFIQVRSFLI